MRHQQITVVGLLMACGTPPADAMLQPVLPVPSSLQCDNPEVLDALHATLFIEDHAACPLHVQGSLASGECPDIQVGHRLDVCLRWSINAPGNDDAIALAYQLGEVDLRPDSVQGKSYISLVFDDDTLMYSPNSFTNVLDTRWCMHSVITPQELDIHDSGTPNIVHLCQGTLF